MKKMMMWTSLAALLAVLTAETVHAADETAAPETGAQLQETFIWSPAAPAGTQAYVAFRKSFELPTVPAALVMLDLFADSRYLLWVNGEQILRGPGRFNPKHPEFDSLDIRPFLRPGKNVLVVLAHHYPVISGRIMRHAPGLTARLESAGREILRTDSSWRCTPDTEYCLSPEAWNSIPDQIDARRSPGPWTTVEFDDAAWQPAVAVDGKSWGLLHPRTLPLPRETELTAIKMVPDGKALKDALPLDLSRGVTDWEFPGGFSGRWMWSKAAAKQVCFKAVWKNAVHGDGAGCAAKVIADNSFTLFVNGREIVRSEDVATGWTGTLDLKDGDVITIDAKDWEDGTRTAGLFAAFAKGGRTVLGTADFRCATAASDAAWRTDAAVDRLEKPDAENVHPAHVRQTEGSVLLDLGRMATGTHLSGGNIEFWPDNYTPVNGGNVPGASGETYDFGDQRAEPVDGYGSMQVHNLDARQTVFAINHWRDGARADVGIGNQPKDNPDWTFAGNAGAYRAARLKVFVRPSSRPKPVR